MTNTPISANVPTPKILLVEDDQLDVLAFKRSLAKKKIEIALFVASDGIEGLKILRGDDGTPAIAPPFIIVLDLNMPRMGGLEFLEELRNDSDLRKSIVFVLTTSEDHRDVAKAYEHLIAGYIFKSKAWHDDFDFSDLIASYRSLVELPIS